MKSCSKCGKPCTGAKTCRECYHPKPVDSFWRRVNKTETCWLWTGNLGARYGQLLIGYRTVKAHRFSYELHIGPIPPGMNVLHKCDVPACVNPAHLFLGTQKQNFEDMERKGRRSSMFPLGPARHPDTKLSREKAAEIRRRYAAGETNKAELARQYGCGRTTIREVLEGRTWL